MLLLGGSAKITHFRGSLRRKIRGSLLRAFQDAGHAFAVFTVDRPVYTNQAVKTSEGPASTVLRCAARVMLTPCFLIRHYCEFSQRFFPAIG